MRLLLAGLCVVSGAYLVANLFAGRLEHAAPIWGIGYGLCFLALLTTAFFLFNKPRRPYAESNKEFIQELEAQGLLVSQDYKAVRAYEMPEFEDEGLHYFLELEQGTVLYLTGQELYDYELIDDGPEFSQPKRFPCTEFTLRRHRNENYIVDILCRGTVLEAQSLDISLQDVWSRQEWPEDGQILTKQNFDELKTLVERKGR